MSTEIVAVDTLPPAEADRLEHLEAVIDRGIQTFVEVGLALAEIRDRRLYRVEHCTFEDYCRERWGWSRQHAYRQIQAAEVARQMSPMGDTVPATERVARALVPVLEEERPRVWAEAQAAAEAEGREVTAADVDRAWRFRAQPILQSMSVEWFTPAAYVEAAREVLGRIDLDPASCEAANRTVQARAYFSAEDDGLAQDWHGRVFCNPPYSGEAGKFAAKLIGEYQAGRVSAGILLVNAQATPNQWFAPLWDWPICFTDHRVAFLPGNGQPTSHPTFGACFVYVGPDPARFAEVFSRFGAVVRRWP